MTTTLLASQHGSTRPARYRSLQLLLLLMVAGSLIGSIWLLPSRVERIMAATERGDQFAVSQELEGAANTPAKPGEARTLVDVALTLGDPELAAEILKRSLAGQPNNVGAMHLLLEVERQRHHMRDVAALDEQIFARTGESDALREAADIYASQGRTPERIDALRRLNAVGRATASDMAELAHRLSDAGAGKDALALLLTWMDGHGGPLPSDIIALSAGLSSAEPEAETIAGRLGTIIGGGGEEGPFHVLIQTYAERSRPELSLIAGNALGPTMMARPGIVLLLAQLDAQRGNFASARRRLEELDRVGKLLPAGLPMLAELDLQIGDIEGATALLTKLAMSEIPEGLPQRLAETAFARDRLDLLRALPITPIASVSPGIGAVIALVRGDRSKAEALALTALAPDGDLADLGPAFVWVLRTLNLQHAAIARLLNEARTGNLSEDELSLLIDIAGSSPADGSAVVAVLKMYRDDNARAASAWALAVARQGKGVEVAQWLRSNASRLPTGALFDVMLVANERSNSVLAHVAATALVQRTDLPNDWTPAEISFAAGGADPMTPGRLKDGLILIGSPSLSDAARGRLIASIAGKYDYKAASRIKTSPEVESAFTWLARKPEPGEAAQAIAERLTLLASVAPQRALEPLSRHWESDLQRLLPVYAATLLSMNKLDQAEAVLESGLKSMSSDRADAILYETMDRVPKTVTLPVLRIGARSGRADWIAAFDEGLSRAGLFGELRASLRARAKAPDLDQVKRQAIATRLVELSDRDGAIAVLTSMPSGVRPDDPGLQQLLFLWGPRANADAIAWISARATRAPVVDVPSWLEHLAYVGAPLAVIDMVEQQPRLLHDASIVRSYAAALLATRRKSKLDLAKIADYVTTIDASVALARLALDSGQQTAGWRAAMSAVEKAPTDATALLVAAQASAAVHRSEEAADLYTRLLADGAQSVEVMVDAADALLSTKRTVVAGTILAEALVRLPVRPDTLPNARLRARVLVLLHHNAEAENLILEWLSRYPQHAGLQADLLQARMTRKGL